ncbi:ABC transporter permease [Streptomyces sp. PBH53]|uniref:ABC transporter permease n=1 Tax=Streptomyces TaxID=1883 RepID=UPI0006554C1D|nr:ABC transporter permease [Streptomyces sp. PBH53]AKN68572.1 ABC transporter permease [Streptomyces sp. PBH53]
MAGPLTAGTAAPALGEGSAPPRVLRHLARLGALLLKRAALLATLLALVFVTIELLPGDAATATSERGESAADVARRRALLGLDRPLPTRFWDWMSGLPTGDLGTSARGERVTDLISTAFPNTLLLGGIALLLTAVLSLALGCWAALRPGGRLDRAVSGTATAVLALPEFVVAVALVLVLSLWTGWLPAVTLTDADGNPASWTMLILPALALTVPQTGWNTRIVRAALADEARAPHVETALLDGLPPHRVLTHHVLPGALPTIAAGLATSTGMLLGGAVVVETIFNYPGVGAVLASAVTDRDTPVIAGVTALSGAVVTGVLLAADLVRDAVAGGRR